MFSRIRPAAQPARSTGFSTIGRLISADSTPNRIESHQIGVVGAELLEHDAAEPDAEEAADLMADEGEAISVANQRVPNISATSAEVGGTVESQVRPVTAPKTIAEKGVIGNEMKATIDSARRK